MNYSQITPALFVGTTPKRRDFLELHRLGIGLVINLRVERPPTQDRQMPAIPVLWLPVFDFPLLPIPLRTLHRGARAALQVIEQGQSVYAHCAEGAHRSVALAACVLILQGHAPEYAMRLLKERRRAADPDVWYIRRQIVRFAERLY